MSRSNSRSALDKLAERASDPYTRFRGHMWLAVLGFAWEIGLVAVLLIRGYLMEAAAVGLIAVILGGIAVYCREVARSFGPGHPPTPGTDG